MIDLPSFSLFRDNMSTLKNISIDKPDSNHQNYMTESSIQAIDFDGVKNAYCNPLQLTRFPMSVDAILEGQSGTVFFIEFKNGYMDKEKQYRVLRKAYDSILIFTDITKAHISDLRVKAEFILVYNEERNSTNVSDETLVEKNRSSYIQPSPSFDRFARMVSSHALEEYICFGLDVLQKYCFNKVHTYTEVEFESFLNSFNHL